MSQSTDAIMAYGVDFGDEPNFPWGDRELDVWWAEQNGLPAPIIEYSEANRPIYRAYWDKRAELEKACPVEVVSHCSGEYPMYVLAARGSVSRAYRGYPEVLKLDQCVGKTTELDNALYGFCKKYGIEIKPPGWLLFSDWS